jgi:hypothetical protein
VTPSIARRFSGIDWHAARASLDRSGFARLPPILTPEECAAVSALFEEGARFRSTIEMARHGYGQGRYRYFTEPLPPVVRALRRHAYPRLAPVANSWAAALRRKERFPPDLEAFRALCRKRGQEKPTPLLLRYGPGGHNNLHRDLYGEIAFPLQLAVFLSRSGADYEGGAFLLVEHRPRRQSRGEALFPQQGEAVIFATSERPIRSARGYARAILRHGVATVIRGRRDTLGIIFHDAR